MKKSVAISLLLLYIISSSGVAVRAYYSSGKLKSINFVLDRSSEKNSAKSQPAVNKCLKGGVAKCQPLEKNSNSPLKQVLNCVTIVSQGFFEAYDDADTTPVCNTCDASAQKLPYPAHYVSVD